jgi:hypothetical protein
MATLGKKEPRTESGTGPVARNPAAYLPTGQAGPLEPVCQEGLCDWAPINCSTCSAQNIK